MKKLIPLLSFLFCFVSLAQTTRPAFVVGVFQQPCDPDTLAKWKSRGINTIVNPVWGSDQFCKSARQAVDAAHAAGFWTIGPDPECDAWNHKDEPDGLGIDPPAIAAQYAVWKEANPARIVFLNLDGRRSRWTALSTYQAYAAGTDWLCTDRYPFNTGDGTSAALTLGDDIDKLRLAAPGKPVLACIECSDQQLGLQDWLIGTPQGAKCRPPTPIEMKAEINLVLAHGAAGIIYFPHRIGSGWMAFDSTTPEIAAVMPAINAALVAPVAPPVQDLDGQIMTIGGISYILRRR